MHYTFFKALSAAHCSTGEDNNTSLKKGDLRLLYSISHNYKIILSTQRYY